MSAMCYLSLLGRFKRLHQASVTVLFKYIIYQISKYPFGFPTTYYAPKLIRAKVLIIPKKRKRKKEKKNPGSSSR